MKPGVGCSEAESTANTAVRSPSPSSRHPRQRTRSPSSDNAARPLVPPAPSVEDKFIWRTPRSRQWPDLGLQRVSRAPRVLCRSASAIEVASTRASRRESVLRQRNDEHERKRWAAASCWHYLAALAIFGARLRELCEVMPGCR